MPKFNLDSKIGHFAYNRPPDECITDMHKLHYRNDSTMKNLLNGVLPDSLRRFQLLLSCRKTIIATTSSFLFEHAYLEKIDIFSTRTARKAEKVTKSQITCRILAENTCLTS